MSRSFREPALRAAYDTIVVGGGAAGCVLARRLSDDSARQVLLIEAGPADDAVAAMTNAGAWTDLLRGPYDWGYDYAPGPHVENRVIGIPRGRVLGGSSSINAMLWYRGHPSDYDAWAAAGCTGWDFASVLPFFKRAEDWDGGATALRGAGGPMRIERARNPHPLALAMLQAAAALGLPMIEDGNGATNEGACLADLNAQAGVRWSAARGYLRPAMGRPNLTVLAGSDTLRLTFEGRRCSGVVHLVDDTLQTTRADGEVLLCAGAIDTPRLLMLSGLGDPAELHWLGISVHTALPGVGRNLQDHPLVMGVNFRAKIPLGPVRDNGGGSMMNWRSGAHFDKPDLHAFIVQGPHALPEIAAAYDMPRDCFAISPGLMGSQSRGFMRLLDANPRGRIELQPNFLSDQSEVDALIAGVEFCLDVGAQAAFADFTSGPVTPNRRLSRAACADFVRRACATFFHTCGTCAMGVGDDAVVDPELQVYGVEGLRIADASIIPTIPTCNTQAPVIMIAERAAALMRGEIAAVETV